jgi:hypothetical protein
VGNRTESSVGQPTAYSSYQPRRIGQGMGRTVRNDFGCSVSGAHTVLCQSQFRHDRTTEVPCSSRKTPSVVISKEHDVTVLTSQRFRFASPIQTDVSGARR